MRLDLERIWMDARKTVLFITHSIDEAVLLADRVAVMSPRPGRIERILEVGIPRLRGLAGRKHPRFLEAVDEVTQIFLARGVLHRADGPALLLSGGSLATSSEASQDTVRATPSVTSRGGAGTLAVFNPQGQSSRLARPRPSAVSHRRTA